MFGKNLFKARKQATSASVLVISDDQDTLAYLQDTLTHNGCVVYATASVTAALALLDEMGLTDIFICDFVDPGREGKTFISTARIRFGKSALPPTLFLMDSPDDEMVAEELGVFDVLPKPVEEERLLQSLSILANRSAAA